MPKLKRMATWVAVLPVCAAMAACTAWHTEKRVAVPQRPQVYSLSVKLMDVNGIDQELGRIPLLIEETREGGRITKVRVEPTGDIRLPGMGVDGDKAFRWEVVSCDAARADEPYTLRVRLFLVKYGGEVRQVFTDGDTAVCWDYGKCPPAEWNADIEVKRGADGMFCMKTLCDNISVLTDIEPQQYMKQPSFLQQSLDLELELVEN